MSPRTEDKFSLEVSSSLDDRKHHFFREEPYFHHFEPKFVSKNVLMI